MRKTSLVLAGVLLATAVFAQNAAPPPARAAPIGPAAASPPSPASGPAGEAELQPPPPPPGGPRGDRPPPPPPGAAVKIDRGPNGTVHVDVHCARSDTTKACADIASRLLAETGAK